MKSQLPFISVFQILLLMFMCFIFYQAYHQGQRQLICNLVSPFFEKYNYNININQHLNFIRVVAIKT